MEQAKLTDTDEKVHKALEKTRELCIPDEKAMPVLTQLLKENGVNWAYNKMDNYTVLMDAILSAEEEKITEASISSNGNRGKNPKVIHTPPPPLKKSYETHSATSGSSTQVVQKQPQLSNGDRKRKYLKAQKHIERFRTIALRVQC